MLRCVDPLYHEISSSVNVAASSRSFADSYLDLLLHRVATLAFNICNMPDQNFSTGSELSDYILECFYHIGDSRICCGISNIRYLQHYFFAFLLLPVVYRFYTLWFLKAAYLLPMKFVRCSVMVHAQLYDTVI